MSTFPDYQDGDINRIFVSYSRTDREIVQKLVTGLDARQLSLWMDVENRDPGDWQDRILEAIDSSRFFLFCATNSSIGKYNRREGFIYHEVERARDSQIQIVPVFLEASSMIRESIPDWITKEENYHLSPNWGESINTLSEALEGITISEESQELSGKAKVFFANKKYEKAIRYADFAIEEDASSYDAWNYKAAALIRLGRLDEAEHALERLLSINSNSSKAWMLAAYFWREKEEWGESLYSAEQAININPFDSFAWSQKAEAQMMLGSLQGALESYNEALDRTGPSSEKAMLPLLRKSRVLNEMGRYQEAETIKAHYDNLVEKYKPFDKQYEERE